MGFSKSVLHGNLYQCAKFKIFHTHATIKFDSVTDVTKTGNGEWGMGNGEWGMGNGEWGMG